MGKLSNFLSNLLRSGTGPASEPVKSVFGPDASRAIEDKAKSDAMDIEIERYRNIKGS